MKPRGINSTTHTALSLEKSASFFIKRKTSPPSIVAVDTLVKCDNCTQKLLLLAARKKFMPN
jgi:hypothetical protein